MRLSRWRDEERGEPEERAIRHELEVRGYRVSRYVYSPGTVFPEHTHASDKIDAVVSGKLRVTVEAEAAILGPGDWIEVPRGTAHTAEVVGDASVVSLDGVKE